MSTQLHMNTFNGALVITVKPKATCRPSFRAATMLFYILQLKNPRHKLHIS
jgi:hypothetical protein